MNKKGLIFGVFLLTMLGIFFIQQTKKTKETPLVKSHKKEVSLGVLQLLSHPALDSIYQGFVEELARQGYEEGKNLKIDFQNAQADQSNLASMSEKLVSEKNDILVGITTPASQALANATKEIPIVMGGITYPVEAGLIAHEEKPGNNITGVSDRTPIQQQIEMMKEILPEMKTLGVLYTASEENAVKQVEEVKNVADKLGLSLKIASVNNTNDVPQVTESLASSVDAIFVPIDNTIASTMPIVAKSADAFNVGIFPSADTMVADGGVFGIGVDQYQIGVKTADVVISILNGASPADTPIVLGNEGILYLNPKKAAQLNITIPKHIRENAKLVGA